VQPRSTLFIRRLMATPQNAEFGEYGKIGYFCP